MSVDIEKKKIKSCGMSYTMVNPVFRRLPRMWARLVHSTLIVVAVVEMWVAVTFSLLLFVIYTINKHLYLIGLIALLLVITWFLLSCVTSLLREHKWNFKHKKVISYDGN